VREAQLSSYLEAGARGRRATDLRGINEDIPIVIRARHVNSIETLLGERIPTEAGLQPLHVFVDVAPVQLPAALMRHGQAPIVRIEADLAAGASLDDGVEAIEAAFESALPADVRGRVGGVNEAFESGLRAMGVSLLLSLLLVYLVLAAQFENLIQPLVVLSTVPLAMVGVVGSLALTGHSINLMSLTGVVVLVGIVVNDAILKVDFINQRRREGVELVQAIQEAGHDRLRPILMTTLTTVLGMLPMAFSTAQGAELRASLAVVLIGGLATATAPTLFVVPALYRVVGKRMRK
jgi:HAE1 family hydrophobic/amphiphilic exporter-1